MATTKNSTMTVKELNDLFGLSEAQAYTEITKRKMKKEKTSKSVAAKKAKKEEERVIVSETKVRIDMKVLSEVISELEHKLNQVGWDRETKEQRSAFSAWNVVNKFYLKLVEEYPGQMDIILPVTQGYSGKSRRLYTYPSITSMAKPVRKAIKPVHDDRVFVYWDIKAAEFFQAVYYSGCVDAVEAYSRGEDIYDYYKDLFPEWVDRNTRKRCLIGFCYDITPYTISTQCGITEAQAENLLRNLQIKLTKIQRRKQKFEQLMRNTKAYWCPDGLDERNLVKVADVDGEFNSRLAYSVSIQSALGIFMEKLINLVSKRTSGSLLTVFDSMLVEVRKDRVEAYEQWISSIIKPFRVGKFGVGESFYEAQENAE